jgi:GNAT superfamily N-acetyltransferase
VQALLRRAELRRRLLVRSARAAQPYADARAGDDRWGASGADGGPCGHRIVPVRNRGIGSALLATVITAADRRSYARLVLSPSARAHPFFRRAGFIVPDDTAGDDRLLVRPSRPR